MKRLIALLLALTLLMSVAPAMAATLLEKFEGQTTEQGFKGTVTFTASGGKTALFGADAWAWVLSAAPRVTLEATHSLMDRVDGQAALNVLIDGKSAGKTSLLYNEALMGVSSDLLAGYDAAWYAAPRDWNLSLLLQGLTQQGSAWPPVWRLIAAVESAPDAWKEKAAQHLVPYETKLGTWLNTYAAVSTVTEENAAYTQLQWVIPAEDVKTGTKALMKDFYADTALLALLGEVATAQEAACYLQPGMGPILSAWVDKIALTGEIEITRRYSAAGDTVLDQVKLPFSESQSLSDLVITVTPEGEGRLWTFKAAARDGAAYSLSCLAAEKENIYSGAVEVTLPAGDDGKKQTVAFDFNGTWDGGKEEYSLTTDRFEQTMEGSLVIKPRSLDVPSQSLTLKAAFSSASSPRASTRLEAELTWRDLDGDAVLTAALSGRTAAPTEVEKLADKANVQRLDQLPGSGFDALLQEWGAHFSAWLQDAAEQLLPAQLPVQ